MAERVAKPPAAVEEKDVSHRANRIESLSQAFSLCFMPSSGISAGDDPYPPIQPSLRNPEFVRKTCEAARGVLPLFGAAGKLKKAESAVRAVQGARAARPLSPERTLPEFLHDVDAVWREPQATMADQYVASGKVLSAIIERRLHNQLMEAAIEIAMTAPGLRRQSLHWVRVADNRDFLIVAEATATQVEGPGVTFRLFDPSGRQLLSKIEIAAPFNAAAARSQLLGEVQSAKEGLEPVIAFARAENIASSWTSWRSWMNLPAEARELKFKLPSVTDPYHRTQ